MKPRLPISPYWLLAAAVIFLGWHTPILYPLKLFVVFLHELSHGIAAWVSGGSLERFVVDADEGGHAISRGGSQFLVLNAGYLGSLLWGGGIMIFSARTSADKYLSFALGLLVAGVSLFFARNVFGFFFGLAFGGALSASGWYLNTHKNDLLLRTIGLTTCIYVLFDITSDVLMRSYLLSDARMLAQLTGIPTVVWGVLWFGIAGAATLFFLALSSRDSEGEIDFETDKLK